MAIKHYKLMRWHVWLGWLIGVPIILWTASGLLMVAQPIETVRGNHLRSEAPALDAITPVAPVLEGKQAKSLTLQQNSAGPFWVIAYADGDKQRADALTGALLPRFRGPRPMLWRARPGPMQRRSGPSPCLQRTVLRWTSEVAGRRGR